MSYTYECDGVAVSAPQNVAPADVLLHAVLGVAAVLSFQRSRPVTVQFQGRPYRVVSVGMANSTTTPPSRR